MLALIADSSFSLYWAIPVLLAIAAIILLVVTYRSHRRDVEEHQERVNNLAQNQALVATLPDPPPSITPYLAAITLVVLGALAFTNNFAPDHPHVDSAQIGSCSADVTVPSRVERNHSAFLTLTSACPQILTNSALYVDGDEKTSKRIVVNGNDAGLGANSNSTGTVYWPFTVATTGPNLILVARSMPQNDVATLRVPASDPRAKTNETSITVANCTLKASAPVTVKPSSYYTVDINGCENNVGLESLYVDGTKSTASPPLLLRVAKGTTDDRWFIKAGTAGTVQQIDVVYQSGGAASHVFNYNIGVRSPITLDSFAGLTTGIFGTLFTLSGLGVAVVTLIRRPSNS